MTVVPCLAIKQEQKKEQQAHTTKNLTLLCKVWGAIKYHHPAMSKNILWDKVLEHSIETLLLLQRDDSILLDSLCGQMLRYADSCSPTVIADAAPAMSFSLSLSLPSAPTSSTGWLDGAPLSLLHKQSLQRLLSRPFSKNYYLSTGTSHPEQPNFNPPFSAFVHEGFAPINDHPTTAQRLIALFRLWNFIRYFYPYTSLLTRNWDDVLADYIPHFVAATTPEEYAKTLFRLCGCLEDAHVWARTARFTSVFGRFALPLTLQIIDSSVVVANIKCNDEYKKLHDFDIEQGDIITSINGEPMDKTIQKLSPYKTGGNIQVQNRDLCNLLRGTKTTTSSISLQRGKEIRTTTFDASTFSFSKDGRRDTATALTFVDAARQIALITLESLQARRLDSVMAAVSKTKGIIFDLRGYPDFLLYELMNYFVAPTPFAQMTTPPYINSAGVWQKRTFFCGKAQQHYQGKVVVLINEHTQSRAELTAMALATIPAMKFVGSQTAGANGDVVLLPLPGDVSISITAVGVAYPDGSPTQRVGIQPHILARPTIAGLRAGRDEVMEKGIEVLKSLIAK
jgi:C-terminal processing protease CtpA/Prc